MRVVIAGGHGKIALLTSKLLSARGDTVIGLIRNPDHGVDVGAAGAEAAVIDLENTTIDALAAHLHGADAVIFAAGAGPGSGVDRKTSVDRDAAILLADAARIAGVRRYLMVSAMGADAEPGDDVDEVFAAYLRAKRDADNAVRDRSDLDTTIVRPGGLTDDDGTGRVRVAESTGRGSIPRSDVAAVLVALLDDAQTAGVTFEVIEGDTAITDATSSVRPQPR